MNSPFQSVPAWDFPVVGTVGDIYAAAVFGPDGTLYFGSCDGNIRALDGNGNELHEFPTGGCVLGVAASADTVYATSEDGNLYALDASLNLKWKFWTGVSISTPPLLYGTAVYYCAPTGTGNNKLYAIDVAKHTPRWTASTGANFVAQGPAAWDGGNGIIIVGSWDKNVYAFDANTGAQIWSYTTQSQVFGAPAIDTTNGNVVLGSGDTMYALDANTGKLKWTFKVANDVISHAAAVQGGNTFFGTDNGDVFALDRNGNQLWHTTVDGPAGSPILNTSNGLVFIAGFHTFFVIDPAKQQTTPLYDVDSFLRDASFSADGLIVAGSAGGALFVIR